MQPLSLKRGHYVLIPGGAVLIEGLVLTIAGALPLATEIQKGTTILQERQVEAGETVTATHGVADTGKPLNSDSRGVRGRDEHKGA